MSAPKEKRQLAFNISAHPPRRRRLVLATPVPPDFFMNGWQLHQRYLLAFFPTPQSLLSHQDTHLYDN